MSWSGAVMALAVSADAIAVGGIADVQIVDRDSGAALSAHYFRGECWVAARLGTQYSIRIRNRGGARIVAAAAVSGVNVLSGASAAYDQQGYICEVGPECEITGWRKSPAEVAAFTFTAAADSYAERTGRPANVGVIGVALFRERTFASVTTAPRASLAPAAPLAGADPVPAAVPQDPAPSPATSARRAGAHAVVATFAAYGVR